MRILVCGGRDFTDKKAVWSYLDAFHKTNHLTTVITGGARGADSLAEQWARHNAVPSYVFCADWNRYGKPAGSIRNQRMLDEGKPDLVVAFPGGPGTADMVRRAREDGVPIREVS